ncbi:MAG: MerR family DNA-binding protein, partial [Dehalococcoidia bacterium]|nr:MerR family DNA-binding protein [Dehalococcoidia bacterium]
GSPRANPADTLAAGALVRETMEAPGAGYTRSVSCRCPAGFTSGGIRLYGQRDVTRLRFIRRLKALGLRIEEIKMTLGLEPPQGRRQRVGRTLELLQLQKARAEEQMAEMARLQAEVDEALAHVGGCTTCSAPKCPQDCPSLKFVL